MTVEDYAFAQAEFHHCKRALADWAARLAEAAADLRERTDRASVEGVGLGTVPVAEPAVIDGAALPEPADIQRMLLRYHGAFRRLRAAWDGLPPGARGPLRPPPPCLPNLVPAA